MRVLVGVAVGGEVFSGGDHPMLLEPAHERRSERGGETLILAVGAHANHGIRGIVVDVEHGRERDVNTDRASFDGRYSPLLIRERRIPASADSHFRWKYRSAAEVDRVRQEIATSGTVA